MIKGNNSSNGKFKNHLVILLEILLVAFAGLSSYLLHVLFDSFNAIETIDDSIFRIVINVSLVALMVSLCNLSVGLYDPKLRASQRDIVRRLFVSVAISYFVIELFVFYIFKGLPLAASFLPVTIAIALLFLIIFRVFLPDISLSLFAKPKVLILGAGERASIIEKRMRRDSDRKGFELVGFVNTKGDKEGIRKEKIITIDYQHELFNYVQQHDISEIVIASDERRNDVPVEQLFNCKMSGVYISDILDFIERETGQIAVNLIYPSWFIYSNGFESNNYLRNSLDYVLNAVLAVVVFIFTWPLMIFAAIAIMLEDGYRLKAPVLYRQQRVGLDGNLFNILKFRSMSPDAEKNGAEWSQKGDSRITKVGGFIRKYRIDELPQLFNVIKGEMGFVGPRPERPEFVKELAQSIPYYNHRHNVKPGLTGWAQLKYPYGASFNDSFEKVKFDLYYIKHQSILLDLLILIRTVEVVLFGKGR
ncbi:TIGR03013 family XrtA/PEP-CTERM system glycosyltransferase [Flocculibacter collagenilyticus]|uniref:TIGR03013 family XrtA/PEP-CTERM system glycosyltransferase n=1 Tax=Flocculibacter collagenilyticus TaxID=2744479 RepID=UPI0018F48595|nr:TIGR03013 family XrtA/PEP-CTERM system glycosyltransferase [Flocculibacter collagenilyticus]